MLDILDCSNPEHSQIKEMLQAFSDEKKLRAFVNSIKESDFRSDVTINLSDLDFNDCQDTALLVLCDLYEAFKGENK